MLSVEQPIHRVAARDINGNDLDNGGKSTNMEKVLVENDDKNEKTNVVIVPEVKRLSLHRESPPTHKIDSLSGEISPVKDHTFTPDFPAYPQFHWPTPFYAGFPHQYHYLPYRFHRFPLPGLPEGYPIPAYPDHINAFTAHGAMLAPFPFVPGISPYQFPLSARQTKCIERENEKNENGISLTSAFDVVKGSPPRSAGPVDLPSPGCDTVLPLQSEKRKVKDGDHAKYQCSDCQKSYSTFSGLSKHKQFHCTHDMNKEFNCKYCDKTYVSLGALKMHIRTHTLPCKCKICGKAFSRPWLLQGHIRTHTGEKPFSCVHCLRAFADRSNLRAHLQTHSDVKKYSCKTCSKTFSRMSLLIKHEDTCCTTDV